MRGVSGSTTYTLEIKKTNNYTLSMNCIYNLPEGVVEDSVDTRQCGEHAGLYPVGEVKPVTQHL